MWVQGLGFPGFGVSWGLGCGGVGFVGSGFRVSRLWGFMGFRVWGCRVCGFRVQGFQALGFHGV